MKGLKASSVTEVVSSIKNSLEKEYFNLTILGEVSNLSLSSAGHYYFNLSDKNCSISCALFKMDALRNPAIRKIKNGAKVLLRGPISVYAKRGTFQVICKSIIPYGEGDLKAQFDFLKEKLNSQGYFDPQKKQLIPTLPTRIAIITALQGAALQDFLNIMKRRSFHYQVTIVPSIVQGDDCPRSLIKALTKVEKVGGFDVVVLARGGGSMEDLWGFNDEELVKKIFSMSIPTISAIGHQIDYTLSDYVCDMRCETPSAAAEILSQGQTQVIQNLKVAGKSLKNSFKIFKSDVLGRLQGVSPKYLRNSIQLLMKNHKLNSNY